MDVFKSKIDKWLLFCLILSIIACLLGASVMLKIGGTFNYVLATVILILGAAPLSLFVTYWMAMRAIQKVNDPDVPLAQTEPIKEDETGE